MMLADALDGRRVRIASVELDGEAGAWLAAVGLHEGEELARAPPRRRSAGRSTCAPASGGEFAVAREVAAKIAVVPLDESEEP